MKNLKTGNHTEFRDISDGLQPSPWRTQYDKFRLCKGLKEVKVKIDKSEFNVITEENKKGKTPLLFLHGFTGSAADWTFLFEAVSSDVFPIALDLPGHGKSLNLEDKFYNLENLNIVINAIAEKLNFNKFILAGYSMGGRAAYRYAVNFPEKLSGLIIESATPGLAEKEFKEERFKADKELAEKINKNGMEWFVDYWFSQSIFSSMKNLPEEKFESVKQKRLKNNPEELAKALIGGSQGKVEHVWNKLNKIKIPLLLIDGEDDKKYRFLDTLVLKEVHTGRRVTVKGAGHNIHLEKPEEFIILVNQFIEKVIKGNENERMENG